jgi:tetratricopeptide (TPR) repeat protein
LNRQGRQAFAEANEILIDVADHGPELLRGKAHVALATNLLIAGDDKAALEMYGEAARIAGSCEHGNLYPVYLTAFQRALIKYNEGDYNGALASIEKLEPLARQVGIELPAVLHSYLNTVAVCLIANARAEEASRFSEVLLTSPFRSAYPEWQNTCNDITLRTRQRSRSFVSMSVGKPFTGEPEALTEGARELPESCGKSPRRAEIAALLLFKVICQQHRRIPIRFFSGRLLRRLSVAARNRVLSRRHIRAYLRPLRWSYLRLYPAYPRPPNF